MGKKSPVSETDESAKLDKDRLPSSEEVVSERTLVSPKGKKYRIITTKEKDPYEDEDKKR